MALSGRSLTRLCRRSKIRFAGSKPIIFSAAVRTMSSRASSCSVDDNILLRSDDTNHGISTLTLNRPKQYNTLTIALLDELLEQLHDIRDDTSVRVVILKSSNPKCFSSGHDLRELLTCSKQERQDLFQKCSSVMMYLTQHLPQPVIAQVGGVCTAAGTQLVASCDLAICSQDSKFGVNGIDVGLFCTTPSVALSRNMHRKHAMQMLLTGDFVSSEQALDYGLVNQVVSKDELEEHVVSLGKRIASKSPYAIQLGKQAFYKQLEQHSLSDAYAFARDVMCTNMDSCDAQEGIQAFLEKRTPEWRGK